MKITIKTCLLAKRDMNVDSAQIELSVISYQRLFINPCCLMF